MNKKILTLVSLLVLASMILAACAPAAPATTAPPAGTEPVGTEPAVTEPAATEPGVTEPAATEPAATEPPTGEDPCAADAIGCAEIPAGGEIHIAYAMVVAGPNETLGVDSRNGIEIAIEDAGNEIAGHPVKFDGQDEGCSAEGGQAAGTALAADPSIVAVIGTSCSSAARVAVPLLSQAGFAIVSPANTAPDLTEEGNENNHPGYLRTAHNDEVQGAVAAQYVFNELQVTMAATIHDGSLYADKLQQVFAAEFESLGGTITGREAVDPNQTDMSSVLTSIAAGSPELIYFPIFLPAGPFIVRQAKQTPGLESTILMGADGLFSPDTTEAAGEDVEGFLVSSPRVVGPAYDEFLAKYNEKFGSAPISIFHAHAYDAFMMIKAAIEEVAVEGADGSLLIPRQALRDALYATTDFQGLTGNLTCTPTGDCADPNIGVYEYHAGEYPPEFIWPTE